jgi:hypothetical protein
LASCSDPTAPNRAATVGDHAAASDVPHFARPAAADGASTIPDREIQPENTPQVPVDRELLDEALPVRGHMLEFQAAHAAGKGDAQAAVAPGTETRVRRACVAG